MFARTHHAACLVAFALLAACSKSAKDDGSATATTSETSSSTAKDALVEAFPNALIAWTIGQDGRVRADVADNDGKSLNKDASGTLEWRSEAGAAESAKITFDETAKALVATGPALKRDVTELKYEIKTAPGPLVGTLHVPVGGTAALVADTKGAETAPGAATPAATGAHGGVVQLVGSDRVEVAADEDSDEVRVYVLDPSGKPMAVGQRKVTLAVAGDTSDVVLLVPSPDGLFLVGKWKLKSDPSRMTIVVRDGGTTRVAIVGWRPGARLVVAGGPKLKIKSKGGFKGVVEVKVDGARPGAAPLPFDSKKDDDDKGHGKGAPNGHNGEGEGKGHAKGGKGK